jgi:hypothetical protein
MNDSAAAFRNEPRLAEPADFFVELRKGSFTDVAAANRLVNVTLQRNRERVDRVVKGESSKEEIDAVFDAPTGKEAFVPDGRTDPRIRETYGVRVVIVGYRRIARGFRVHTAFPRNFDPAPAS